MPQEHQRLQRADALVFQSRVLEPVSGHHVRVEVEPGQVLEEHEKQVRGEPGPECNAYLLDEIAELRVRQPLRLQYLARGPRRGRQHLGYFHAPPCTQRPEANAHLVAEQQVQQRKYRTHVSAAGTLLGGNKWRHHSIYSIILLSHIRMKYNDFIRQYFFF